MNTEELGNIIEKWQNANWNYVTKEQCENFRNEYEKETENEDIKAIIENIKEHMVTHNWEYTPVSEEVSEEEEMNAEIKELLKDDNNYDKICEALKTAETKLNTFIKKSNETINKKKTVIFNLAAKKEVLERGVKDTVILKQIRRARELAAKLKDIEENHK